LYAIDNTEAIEAKANGPSLQ